MDSLSGVEIRRFMVLYAVVGQVSIRLRPAMILGMDWR